MSGAARILPEDCEDPFGAAADPARYVPRDATERALVELESTVVDHEASAVLVGVPGIGKTLLLRLLRRRLEPRMEVIHLPYAALPAAALANWALDDVGALSSWDPLGALATRARHSYMEGRGGVALLIDDGEALPEETARALAAAVREAEGGLRVVAAVDEESETRVATWLGSVTCVALLTPMTAAESFQFVHTRLHGASLPPHVLEAFDPDTITRVHERAGGIPGRLCAEASRVLMRQLLAPPTPAGSETALPADTDKLLDALFPEPLEPGPEPVEAPVEPVEAPRPAAGAAPEADEPASPAETAPPVVGDPEAFARAARMLARAHHDDMAEGQGAAPGRPRRSRARTLVLALSVLAISFGVGVTTVALLAPERVTALLERVLRTRETRTAPAPVTAGEAVPGAKRTSP